MGSKRSVHRSVGTVRSSESVRPSLSGGGSPNLRPTSSIRDDELETTFENLIERLRRRLRKDIREELQECFERGGVERALPVPFVPVEPVDSEVPLTPIEGDDAGRLSV